MQRITTTQSHQSWMNAVTFAEAGEWDTAREMIPEGTMTRRNVSFLSRVFAAAAFAEEGLTDEAGRLMGYPRTAKSLAGQKVPFLSRIFAAAAFAEEGLTDEAVRIMDYPRTTKSPARQKVPFLSRIFAAAAFAEEGLADEAVRIMDYPRTAKQVRRDFISTLGLEGIRLSYGVLAVEPHR